MFNFFKNFFEFRSKFCKILKAITVLPYINRIQKLKVFWFKIRTQVHYIFHFRMRARCLNFFPFSSESNVKSARPLWYHFTTQEVCPLTLCPNIPWCVQISISQKLTGSFDYIVVVTKKPPMCQIMYFSLYCMNGLIEGRHID